MSEKSPATEHHFPIDIVGRHVQVTEAMKQYAEEKVGKMERFSHQIIDAVVTMDIQKLEQRVTIRLKVGHTFIKVSATSEDMYASVDMAVAKLQHKLWKYRSRLKEHHARPLSVTDINVNVIKAPEEEMLEEINDEITEENLRRAEEALAPHEIVTREKRPLKILRHDEAVMKLDLSGEHFLLFRGEEDQKLKVLYMRDDGDYGLIEAE